MNLKIPAELTAFLRSFPVYYCISHEDPDGDCIASSLALASFLRRMGKEVELFSPGPFTRPEIADFEHYFKDNLPKRTKPHETGVVILDCSTLDRIGTFGAQIQTFKRAVIDHHSGGRPFGDIQFIHPEVPSVTYLIQLIIERMAPPVTEEEARLLLLGLCTDTGFFRHLDSGTGDVLSSAGRLTEYGASLKDTYNEIYGRRKLSSRILLGRVLSRTVTAKNGKILFTHETSADREELGEGIRDSDTLYSLLLVVEGAEILVYAREEQENLISVGLRSRKIDISGIALSFGGGGHPNASGFTYKGTIRDLQETLLGPLHRILEAGYL